MFRRQAQNELDGAIVVGSPDPRWSAMRPIVLAVVMVLFTGLFFYFGRHLINQTNGDRNRSDQQNNIRLALIAKDHISPDISEGGSSAIWRSFPHHTDGVVNPLWPWLAARVHRDADTEELFFIRGKWLNLSICAAALLLGTGIAATRFSLPATINLLLLAGLGALLPRAVWFQPEPLYFILFLAAWISAISALIKNSLWRYAIFGLLVGLAYLAKASALPLLAAFLGVSTLRCLWCGLRYFIRKHHGDQNARWCPQAHLVGTVLCILTFLMTAGPRLSYASERFGAPFHSFTSYWMWMDDFETECKTFMLEHGTKTALQAIPDDQRPSFSHYRSNHTDAEFAQRLSDGMLATAGDFLQPKRARIRDGDPDPWRVLLPARGTYLYLLAAILLGLWLWSLFGKPRPEIPIQRMPGAGWTVAIFVVGSVVIYLGLYGWYRPIGKGDRFMLSLYAPLALALVWGAEGVRERILLRGGNRRVSMIYYAAHLCITIAILVRVVQLTSDPSFFTK
jgi:hypothetical protein